MMNVTQQRVFDALKAEEGVWRTPTHFLVSGQSQLDRRITKRELAEAVSYLEGQGLAQRKKMGDGRVHYRWIPGAEPGKGGEPVNWAGRTFGQLSPDEKRRAAREAGRKLEAELRGMADVISEVIDDLTE